MTPYYFHGGTPHLTKRCSRPRAAVLLDFFASFECLMRSPRALSLAAAELFLVRP